MTVSLILKKIGVTTVAIAGAGIMWGPAGGYVPLCKTWVWDGNDYDGRWWTTGPSTLPSYSYLQRREDGGTPINSRYSGSYYDRDEVVVRVCDRLAGRCGGWW